MDWNRIEGNWKQITGKVKEKWGKLTDDDLDGYDWAICACPGWEHVPQPPGPILRARQ